MSLGLENRNYLLVDGWTALAYLRKMWLAFGILYTSAILRAQLLFCWLGNGTAGFWTVGWDGRFAFGVDLSDRDLESLEGRFRRFSHSECWVASSGGHCASITLD